MKRNELENALLAWIAAQQAEAVALTRETQLLEQGLVSSLQVLDLLLLVEELTGRPVDLAALQPGAFASVAALVATLAPEVAA